MDIPTTDHMIFTNNSSEMESKERLNKWNEEEIRSYLGTTIFLSVSILLGLVGNGHVLFIYVTSFRKSKRKLYFVWLASLDLLTCIVLIPFTLFYLFNKVTYHYPVLCKIYMFLAYFFSGGSGFTLLVVTIDRYKAICTPTQKQMTTDKINLGCALTLVIWTILIIPACFLYGERTVNSHTYNVTGFSCECQNGYESYYMYKIFRLSHFALFLVGLVIMFVLYGRALFTIVRHKSRIKEKKDKNVSKFHLNAKKQRKSSKAMIGEQTPFPGIERGTVETSSSTSTELIPPKCPAVDIRKQTTRKKQLKARRLTIMFIILTAAVTLSWLPYYIAKVLQTKDKAFYNNMSYTGAVMVKILRCSYFVSNVHNPIIYCVQDPSFRAKLLSLYRK